jgi:hypothetical protein
VLVKPFWLCGICKCWSHRYVHIMREGGKPVVLLLNVFLMSSFCVSLFAKEEARYRQLTGMYRSRQRHMLLF